MWEIVAAVIASSYYVGSSATGKVKASQDILAARLPKGIARHCVNCGASTHDAISLTLPNGMYGLQCTYCKGQA